MTKKTQKHKAKQTHNIFVPKTQRHENWGHTEHFRTETITHTDTHKQTDILLYYFTWENTKTRELRTHWTFLNRHHTHKSKQTNPISVLHENTNTQERVTNRTSHSFGTLLTYKQSKPLVLQTNSKINLTKWHRTFLAIDECPGFYDKVAPALSKNQCAYFFSIIYENVTEIRAVYGPSTWKIACRHSFRRKIFTEKLESIIELKWSEETYRKVLILVYWAWM